MIRLHDFVAFAVAVGMLSGVAALAEKQDAYAPESETSALAHATDDAGVTRSDAQNKEEKQAEQDAAEVEKEPTQAELADAKLNECLALHEKGNFEAALVKANEAIEIGGNDPDYYSMRASCYIELKQYPKALKDYNKAISLTVGNARDYRNRGELYVKMEKYDEAVADCSKAVKLNPKYGAAYWWRAKALEKLGKADEAAKDMEEAKANGYGGPSDDVNRDQSGNSG